MSADPTRTKARAWLLELSLVPLLGFLAALLLFAGPWASDPTAAPVRSAIVFVLLLSAVGWGAFSVLRHAEALAQLLGQPLGTIVLTLSVILIEVAMIVALLVTGPDNPTVARDTMFAVLMIVLNGLVGACLLVGGIRHHQQRVNVDGAGAFLSALIVLGGLSLVLPTVTVSKPGGEASLPLSFFLIVTSLLVYGFFLFIQTGRYRGWFKDEGEAVGHSHLATYSTTVHVVLLIAHLVPIVLLAKQMATFVDAGIHSAGLPTAIGGALIAAIVLAPEGMVAIRAAAGNSIQQSVNICLGSGLATIGLTVPAILLVAFLTGESIELGLLPWNIVLLAVTFLLSMQTLPTGRTSSLLGVLHLVLFGAYVVLIFE